MAKKDDGPEEKKSLEEQIDDIDNRFDVVSIRKHYKVKLLARINKGEIGLLPELEQLEKLERGEMPGKSPTPSTPGTLDPSTPAEFGIPERLRIRRQYTMSEEALQQRKDAANTPAKAKGMIGNRNAWKTGEHTKGFIRQVFRPCKSTCAQYPCSLVSDGETEPGEICLDKIELARTINSVEKAITSGDMTDLNNLMSLRLASALDIYRMLQEDLMLFNTHLKSEKLDKEGNVIGFEIKSHPSLIPFIKLTEVLKVTPADQMITPKELSKKETDDEENNTLAGLMSIASRALTGKKLKVPGEEDE